MEELAAKLIARLQQCGGTVATAESCTGGMIAQTITAVPGASEVFEYGAVTYANRIKEKELGVSGESLAQFGAVSEPVARQMAEGVRKKAGATLGLSTTGIAGPGGGTPQKPVGTVYIAVSSARGTVVQRLSLLEQCGDNRRKIREETVKRVLCLALDELEINIEGKRS